MKNKEAKAALQKYYDAGTSLAEAVKRNIQHENLIDNATVLALNSFIIAANELADLNDSFLAEAAETDVNLQ